MSTTLYYSGADFPQLYACGHVTGPTGRMDAKDKPILYDAKFCPFLSPADDPIFAVTGGPHVFVCRPVARKLSKEPADLARSIEILTWIRDDDREAIDNNSLAWTVDPVTHEPWVCVTGSATIKIFSATTGRLVRSLNGHGGSINDLVVSPVAPYLLCSASADKSILIWNLHPSYEAQPIVAVFAGANGHKEEILALGFHRSGRYLLSGGHDNIVNVWVVPELPEKNNSGGAQDDPIEIAYPHFASSEVHSDFVDCAQFYGDVIFSRCANENAIVVWEIEGFSSNNPVPSAATAPVTPLRGRSTQSGFHPQGRFRRLLQLQTRQTESFYMRFSIWDSPMGNSMLAMGNLVNKMFFWDIASLADSGHREGKPQDASQSQQQQQDSFKKPNSQSNSNANSRRREPGPSAAASSTRPLSLTRASSVLSNGTTNTLATSASGQASNASVGPGAALKSDDVSSFARPIRPHKITSVPRMQFASRQVTWSPDGRWCVQVGEHGMVCVYRRGGEDAEVTLGNAKTRSTGEPSPIGLSLASRPKGGK